MKFGVAKRSWLDDQGAVAIVVAVFAVLAMIMLAFVIDRGLIYVQRTQLQNAVDAAALAAIQETCFSPEVPEDDIREVAFQYLRDNDVDKDDPSTSVDVIVQDDVLSSPAFSGVSVVAQVPVNAFFGSFAGVSETTVAARATSLRTCLAPFRMVANNTVGFSGGGSVSGRIYAGQCFRATGTGGTYDSVAVSIPFANTTTCAPPTGSHGIEPAGNTVSESIYESPQPTLDYAYSQTPIGATLGFTKAAMDAKLAGTQNCGNFATDIVCNGQVTIPNNFTVTVNIITSYPVTVPNNSLFNGAVMYTTSNSFSPANPAIQAKAGGNPATVYFAPNGLMQGTGAGSSTENAGIVIANTIDFNGGTQDATGGANLRYPGEYRLSQ